MGDYVLWFFAVATTIYDRVEEVYEFYRARELVLEGGLGSRLNPGPFRV